MNFPYYIYISILLQFYLQEGLDAPSHYISHNASIGLIFTLKFLVNLSNLKKKP